MLPITKCERGLVMVEFLLHLDTSRAFSRLSLTVVAGFLQSLVEATPNRLGSTHLHRLHAVVHPPDLGSGDAPFYTNTQVLPLIQRDLQWWFKFLSACTGCPIRTKLAKSLIPTWGDGSGTGTGFTKEVPGLPMFITLGQWPLHVFKFSSNWKEISTLLMLTLFT